MQKRVMRKRKPLNFNGLIVLFIVGSLFFSVGYSLLVQDLTIEGTANLVDSSNNSLVSSDDLKFIHEENMWYSNLSYYYQIDMSLENISFNDVKDWQVIIDVPDDAQLISNWTNDMVIKDGKLYISNGLITLGEKIEFGCQISTSADNFVVTNVILNGEKIMLDDSKQLESGNLEVILTPTNHWSSGSIYFFQYEIVVKNISDFNINSWRFELKMPVGAKLESMWGANYINKDNTVSFSNLDYNGVINTSSSISFGGIFSSNTASINFEVGEIVVGS